LNAGFPKKLCERLVKDFLDVWILKKLSNGHPLSGNDIIAFLHYEFGLLISPGTVYSTLYSLERESFVEGASSERKRFYVLTEKGRAAIEATVNDRTQILRFLAELLKPNRTFLRSQSP